MAAATRSEYGRTLVHVLALSGLRVGELAALTWGDVDFDREQLRGRRGKTASSSRTVRMSPELQAHLCRWLAYQEARGVAGESRPVMATRSVAAMTPPQAWKSLRRAAARVGLGDRAVSPHTLRRSFGTTLVAGGAPMHHVSRLLGHSTVQTTERS